MAEPESRSIGEWMAQQKDWQPGERREIPRTLAEAYWAEIAARVTPRIMAQRRAQAEAYQKIKDMVIL